MGDYSYLGDIEELALYVDNYFVQVDLLWVDIFFCEPPSLVQLLSRQLHLVQSQKSTHLFTSQSELLFFMSIINNETPASQFK